jgi:hypothetical protein
MLRRLICAASRSAEPSGNAVRSFVMRASKAQSSIPVMRISSVIVSTRIVSSIVFRPHQSRPSAGGLTDAEGGCIACDGNGEDERFSACSHAADRRCDMADKKDEVGAVGMEKGGC